MTRQNVAFALEATDMTKARPIHLPPRQLLHGAHHDMLIRNVQLASWQYRLFPSILECRPGWDMRHAGASVSAGIWCEQQRIFLASKESDIWSSEIQSSMGSVSSSEITPNGIWAIPHWSMRIRQMDELGHFKHTWSKRSWKYVICFSAHSLWWHYYHLTQRNNDERCKSRSAQSFRWHR